MPDESRLKLAFRECSPALIRNVCIIAHVDHGKTTLADFLVSSNGIISARLAGKLRYMDSREDEQMRGITMKSSSIALYFEPLLLNLIDSPGHVDFVSEVSSAINLADIAILVVDVVEGVCSQTETLMRQAVFRKLDILLVINKIDRLVVELKMREPEARRHLQRLIESVNSFLSQAIHGQLLEEDWHTFERMESRLHFDPAKGNVLFSSALHGYAFALGDFASLWAKRIFSASNASTKKAEVGSKKEEELRQKLNEHLFSADHFFSVNSQQICSGAEQRGKKPLLEQFVLEPLWELHRCALIDADLNRLRQIATKLALPQLKGKRPDEIFSEMMRQWLPLSLAVVNACARMKSAQKAFQMDDRIKPLLSSECEIGPSTSSPAIESLRRCDPDDQLTLVFAAKAFKVDTHRVSLCRVMGGTLKTGDHLHVLHSIASHQSKTSNLWQSVEVSALYLLLGRELIPVERVPAGRICGVEAADDQWISGQTLCSKMFPPEVLPRMDLHQKFAEPLIRVTVRPSNAGMSESNELKAALRQLAVLDSAVRILEQENGDLAMLTAGEVHLQKCLEDLNALGQTDIVVSEPIVPFLETLIPDVRLPYAKIQSEHLTECYLRHFALRITLRAVPLHDQIVQLIQRNLKPIDTIREVDLTDSVDLDTKLDTFHTQLKQCACDCLPKMKGSWWAKKPTAEIQRLFSQIWAFGPPRARPNILFNNSTMNAYDGHKQITTSVWEGNLDSIHQAVVAGFQLAMLHGPLCEEPMQGIGIVLEGWKLEDQHQIKNDEEGANDATDGIGGMTEEARIERIPLKHEAQLHGQLISSIRQTCRAALKKHIGALRLLAAMYRCAVQTPTQSIGKVQAVLSQKRAKLISEEVNEITGLFEVTAHLPVVESFSFCDDLRKRTSGTASAQMEFSHWQLIEEDPYWQPTTEEEVEEFGSRGLEKNQARLYMDTVRRRKGLPTEEVIVIGAEKQRNLKKNK